MALLKTHISSSPVTLAKAGGRRESSLIKHLVPRLPPAFARVTGDDGIFRGTLYTITSCLQHG